MVVKVWREMWNVGSFQFRKSGGFPLKTISFFDYSNREIGFLFLTFQMILIHKNNYFDTGSNWLFDLFRYLWY